MHYVRCMFRYHHNVDLYFLREAGVRTFREVEEMIEGYSFSDFISESEWVYKFTGFTSESKGLQVLIKEIGQSEDVEILTLDVRKPSVQEIIKNFCRYCH